MEYFNQKQFSNFRIHSALLVIKLPLDFGKYSKKGQYYSHHTRIMGCIALRRQNESSDQFREVVDPRYPDILPQTVINLCV